MATECAYDYVFVYDGNSPDNALLLGSFSGRTLPPKLLARYRQGCQTKTVENMYTKCT
jgi:hypothetical protein